jgi:glycosyltransferase involved in cell wall biosynthesis
MKYFLFDLIASQPNSDGAFHGGGKYAKKVFFEIVKYNGKGNWVIYAVYDSANALDADILNQAQTHNITLIDAKEKSLPAIVAEFKINRFYTALPFSVIAYKFNELLNQQACQLYVTIHGLRTLETAFPFDALAYISSPKEKLKMFAKKLLNQKLFKRDKERYQSLLNNTNVIAVSNHTKYSIASFFPSININNINVFYSPDVTSFDDEDNSDNIVTEQNYFLLVSGNRWLKNNLRSAMALDELFTERKDITQNVIITGVKDTAIYTDKLKNKHRFKFFSYVSEPLLKDLYKNAYAFIYMSLNEGFGYPPLEAMKYGIPVITNSFTSIFEICDNAVLYSNPHSIPEIKCRVLQVLDSEYHSRLSAKGIHQYNLIKQRQTDDLVKCADYLLS